ncbi:hypothetical protein M9458_012983, partial [Cirrhinus mrigala]
EPLGSPSLPSSSGVSGGVAQTNSYASSPLSLFRLQEQFRQHMAATNNLMHYPAFDVTAPSSLPYLGVNVNMASPLGSLPCQPYYQTLSQAQQMLQWSTGPQQQNHKHRKPASEGQAARCITRLGHATKLTTDSRKSMHFCHRRLV